MAIKINLVYEMTCDECGLVISGNIEKKSERNTFLDSENIIDEMYDKTSDETEFDSLAEVCNYPISTSGPIGCEDIEYLQLCGKCLDKLKKEDRVFNLV